MKKIYNTPEVELHCFAPVEQIASSEGIIIEGQNDGISGNSIFVDITKLKGLQ